MNNTATPTPVGPTQSGPTRFRPSSRTRRLALPALGLAIAALASACGGGGNSYGGSSSTPQQPSAAGTVGTRSTSVGTILTNGAGDTLYAFAADKKGVSRCADSCLTYWPPVTSAKAPKAASDVTAHLGTITGTDGATQLTVDGWPMYTYVGDHGPGDTAGQGLDESGGLWWVVRPDGTWIKASSASSSSSSSGGGSRYGY